MRIGFYFPTLCQDPSAPVGGGDLYISKLVDHLNGVQDVEAVFVDEAVARDVDIVHVYGFGTPKAAAVLNLKDSGCRVVLMPNWWHDPDLARIRFRAPGQKVVEGIKSSALLKWNSEKRRRRAFALMAEAVRAADVIAAYSDAEIRHIEEQLNVKIANRAKIGVAVEPFFYNADPQPFIAAHGVRDFILYVARMDDQKNHINFMRAVQLLDDPPPVVCIGRAPDTERYQLAVREIKKLAGGRVIFIDQIPHEQLASAYAAARVYAHPSLFEIPGLAPLEAAAAGCRLVITERGCTREIFGNHALYCNPMDPRDIKNKIQQALETPANAEQAEYFHNTFSWENAMVSAIKIYRDCLDCR
jgi:glycosyltransferase involved in cell wall biosynthesis